VLFPSYPPQILSIVALSSLLLFVFEYAVTVDERCNVRAMQKLSSLVFIVCSIVEPYGLQFALDGIFADWT